MKPMRLKSLALGPLALKPLALRSLGYDDCYHYLIRNGIPQGASFLRGGAAQLDDGTVFAANVPPKYDGRYLHHGQETNLIEQSAALSLSPWDNNIGGTVISVGATTAPFNQGLADKIEDADIARSPWLLQTYTAIPGDIYTFSVWVRSDATPTITIWAYGDAAQSQETLQVTQEWARVKYTFTTNAADTFNRIGFNSVSVDGVYVWGAQLTKTQYSITPIYIPTTGASASIDTAAASSADLHGLTWDLSLPENSWAWGLLGGASSGILSIKDTIIKPTLTQWKTTGDLNLLSLGDGSQLLYIDEADGKLTATDGTNTCKSPAPYEAGTPFDEVLLFSADGKMRIDKGGVKGVEVDFGGTFLHGTDTLKFGIDNEDLVMPGSIYGKQGLKTLPATAMA